MAQSNLQSLMENCEVEVSDITKKRVPFSVVNLLSIDVLPQTKNVCITITSRMCMERVQQWLKTHVTIAVFTKDFNNEVQKILCGENRKVAKEKPVFLLPSSSVSKDHNEEATSAFHLLERIKVRDVLLQ